jgi:hypothetical protein
MALELRNQFSHGRASLQYVRNLAAVQQCPLMAHRDILRRRTSLIATGAIAEVEARASTQEGDARDPTRSFP